MKIALCLHGYFANAGGIEASVKGAAYIKKNIIKDKLVDVFVNHYITPYEYWSWFFNQALIIISLVSWLV